MVSLVDILQEKKYPSIFDIKIDFESMYDFGIFCHSSTDFVFLWLSWFLAKNLAV